MRTSYFLEYKKKIIAHENVPRWRHNHLDRRERARELGIDLNMAK